MKEGQPKEQLLTPQQIARALGRPEPTQEQAAIISSPLQPRLVVAGAGSGKTATMVDRVVWLVANGLVRADQVLGVTFTRKAAGELRERMRSRLEELRRQGLVQQEAGPEGEARSQDPTILTYHSYANSLVKQYGLRLGIEEDVQMLGEAQTWQLVAQILEHYEGKLPEQERAKSSMVEAVLKLSGECAEHLVSPQQLIDWCQQTLNQVRDLPRPTVKGASAEHKALVQGLELRIFYAELIKRYASLKKQMQVMDYGDLIAQAARVAREVPLAAQTERQRFAVVLLDEFQDTSHAQMQLFSDLFGAKATSSAHPVMAVGDPKQSIYGFRGASDGQLFSFYDYFPTEDRSASYLTVAWRNDQAILAAANRVAQPLALSPEWVQAPSAIEVPPLQARPGAGEGRLLVGQYLTDRQEASELAAFIADQRKAYQQLPQEQMPTMAVLCKKRAMMGPLQQAFEQAGVPYQVVGLGGLLDTPEIVDMVAVLRVLSDPGRSDALMRIMAGARWRLGVSDLLAFGDWAQALKRQRELEIRFGLGEQEAASWAQQQLADEAASESADAEPAQAGPVSADHYRRLLQAAAPDVTDSASLVEALENLPEPGWVSAASGRSLSLEGLSRLRALAAELDYLRQFTADDLTSLLGQIERTLLLDIELAARPGVAAVSARRHLDAFYEAAAAYESGAPRLAALLDLAGRSGAGEEEPVFLPGSATASAAGITGFLAWLDAAAQQEKGLEMAAEPPRQDLVQILTVHASKGLEWDQVYLPGLAQGDFPDGKDERWTKQGDSLPWPLRGDRHYLPGWQSDFENLRDLGEFIALLAQQATEHRVLEERRLAYVGFTRARSLLFLAASAWKGTGVKPRDLSDFLLELLEGQDLPLELLADLDKEQVGQQNPQAASISTALWPFDPFDGPQLQTWSSLEELEEGAASLQPDPPLGPLTGLSSRQLVQRAARQVLAGGMLPEELEQAQQELAARGGVEAPEVEADIRDWQEEARLLLELLKQPLQEQALDLPAHLPASTLVALAQNQQEVINNFRRPMPQRPGLAARLGTVFHSWIEDQYGRRGQLDFEEDFDDGEEEQELDLALLQENFLKSKWADLDPWELEYPIETPLGGLTVRGRIDAVFASRNQEGQPTFTLVDWKTGRPPKSQKELEQRSVQLGFYRLAFARLQGLDPQAIKAYFFYAQTGESLEISDIWTEQKLEGLIAQTRQGLGG